MVKQKVYELLEIERSDNKISNHYERFMAGLIILNVVAVILETVKGIKLAYGTYLAWFDAFSLIVLTIEYLAYIWSCNLNPKYSGHVLGRLKFMLTPMMIINLLVIAPFYLPLFIDVDARFMLILRFLRVFRVFKLTRYSQSFNHLITVVKNKQYELISTLIAILILLVLSSSVMYYIEGSEQPEVFSSIPASMWWGIITLTTVGYGDAYPVTIIGKLINSFIAILGVMLLALPTAIISAGFMEEISECSNKIICPHCNKEIDS